MPALARWTAVDPLAEKHPEWSPYNYVLNNPLALIDPDGRQEEATKCDNCHKPPPPPPCEACHQPAKSTGIGLGDVAAVLVVGAAAAIPVDGPAGEVAAAGALASRLSKFGSLLKNIAQAIGIGTAASVESDESKRSEMLFRHYTHPEGFMGISGEGIIRPSEDGLVYVTPTIYPSGATAQEALTLSRTPVGFFEIPQSRLPGLMPLPPTKGGGIQLGAPGPVPAAGLRWVPIGP